MNESFARTALLIGREGVEKLSCCRVAVFGLGGVGGYAVEALARSGVGALDLIDKDTISRSNINRQILADENTIGRLKTDVAAERVTAINPDCKVTAHSLFFLPGECALTDLGEFDYIIDAVDTVTAKLYLVSEAERTGTPIICSMGTGDKLDPTRFRVGDIYDTQGDGLSRAMRKECRRRGIKALKCVYSTELSAKTTESTERPDPGRRSIPGSVAFVPSVAGLILASEVIKDLIRL